MSYYGVDGKLVLSKEGIAGWKSEYNERGLEVCRRFYGIDGNLTLSKDGCAECRVEYDTRGNRTKVSYYGVDGRLKRCSSGFAGFLIVYNDKGGAIKMEYFDEKGETVLPTMVIVSAKVLLNSTAAQKGVKEGDVWCRLGAYDILKTSNIYDIATPLQLSRNTEKTLVVARKVGDKYEIHSFDFAPGVMGIEMVDQIIYDYDKVLEAYRAFCEKNALK